MESVFSFAPGPTTLFKEVVQQAKDELPNWRKCGLGVMELSHRSPEYLEINKQANEDLRKLLNVPETHHILFMQGGATLQYSAVPMNMLKEKGEADYLVNGIYGLESFKEAKKYCAPNLVSDLQDHYDMIPEFKRLSQKAAYFYFVDNETENGLEFHGIPAVENILVSDMSSSLATKSFDLKQFGCVFASVQSNLGTAGHCIVIAREDCIGNQKPYTPSMFDWKKTLNTHSIFNTPPCYSIYFSGLCAQYMLRQGGVGFYEELATRKSKLIYDTIDSSHGFYQGVAKGNRSRTSVVFRCKAEEAFLQFAAERGLKELKGKLGIRACLQNGMGLEGAESLREAMIAFQEKHEH